nr:MAG TPA: tail tape measure [Caudoviricetes sp.]
MGTAVELATGYVTLAVETSHLARQIASAFGGAGKVGAAAGRDLGQNMAKAFDESKPVDMKALEQRVSDAQARMAQAVEIGARKRAAAASSIEQAELKLSAAQDKHSARVTAMQAAEERLASVRSSGSATQSQVAAAEAQLSNARAAVSTSLAGVRAAEDRVTSARQRYSSVSRAAVTEISAHHTALKSAQSALDSTRTSQDELTGAIDRTSGRFGKIGALFRRGFSGMASQARAGFKDAFKSADDEAHSAAKSSASVFGGVFKKALLAGGGLFAGVSIFNGLKDSISAAGDIEQSVGAVDSVFKQSAGQMHSWAQNSAKNLGISANAYNELASVLGASLKNGGTSMDQLAGKTNDLITLGADLASMYGGTTKEAIEAISAALRGETDPIERYGISINDAALSAKALQEGIQKSGGAFTTQQKQLLTQKLLFEQSADAQGNFNRESDTYAHKIQVAQASFENLKVTIGEAFLPAVSAAMDIFSSKVMPVIETVAGGIRAFAEAWRNFDGDVTSSGFAGWMEEFAFAMRTLYEKVKAYFVDSILPVLRDDVFPVLKDIGKGIKDVFDGLVGIKPNEDTNKFLYDFGENLGKIIKFVVDNVNIWGPFAEGILISVAAFKVWQAAMTVSTAATAAWQAITSLQTTTMFGLTLATWGWLGIFGLIIGALILAYNNLDWFKNIIDVVFQFIGDVIRNFVDWFNGNVMPIIIAALQAIGNWFVGLWNDYVKPAWDWIMSLIGAFVDWFVGVYIPRVQEAFRIYGLIFTWLYENIVKPVFDGVVTFIKAAIDVIAAVFTWLYESIILPVWTAIKVAVAVVLAVLLTLWDGVVWMIQNVLGPVFQWLYEYVIKPVWEGIQAAIQFVFDWWNNTFIPAWNLSMKAYGELFNWLYENIIKPVWSWIQSAIQAVIDWWNNTLVPAWNLAMKTYGEIFTWLYENIIKPVWSWIQSAIQAVIDWWNNTLVPAWNLAMDTYGKIFKWVYDTWIKPVWDWIQKAIQAVIDWWNANIKPAWDLALNALGTAFKWLYETWIKPAWDSISNAIKTGWEQWIKPVFDTLSDWVTNKIPQAFDNAVKAIDNAWKAIQEVVKAPVKFVLQTVVNDGFIRHFNDLADKFHIDKLPPIDLSGWATGGWTGPGSKYQPAGIVHADEFVVKKSSRRRFESENPGVLDYINRTGRLPAGVGGYAEGGLVESIGGAVINSDLWKAGREFVGSAAGKVLDTVIEPLKGVIDSITSKYLGFPGQLMRGGAITMIDGAANWVKDTLKGKNESGGNAVPVAESNGGVMRWKDTVIQALGIAGLPTSEPYVNAWLSQIQSESNGDPNVTQNGYVDVNTLTGDLAMGLVQVIGATFAAFRDPSLPNNRLDPLANLVAGMRYAKARYGYSDMLGVIGHGHGYHDGGRVVPTLFDKGGLITRGVQVIDHQRKTPDYVLTASQWDSMHRIAVAADKQSGPSVYIDKVQGYTGEEVAEEIIKRKRREEVLSL